MGLLAFIVCHISTYGQMVNPNTRTLIKYTLEINNISPGVTYDKNSGVWTQSYQMAGNKVTLKYTLTNFVNAKTGKIKADIDGKPLLTATANSNKVGEMPASTSFSGEFYTTGFSTGSHKLHIAYISDARGVNGTYEVIEKEMSYDYVVSAAPIVDNDRDGIDDNLERWLLDRYSPYFKFSSGESIYPIDAAYFITHCDFKLCGTNNGDCDKNGGTIISHITNPTSILSKDANADVTHHAAKSAFHLSPIVGRDLVSYLPLPSEPAANQKAAGNIGLYGHVVPIKLPNPYYYDIHHPPSSSDIGSYYYKIEYWQFFSYNDANSAGVANHEGDWATVQLIVEKTGNTWKIGTVLYYAHGHETQFQMNQVTQGTEYLTGNQGEKLLRYKGINYGKSVTIKPISNEYSATLHNNQVSFYLDPNTGEYTHPVVYPEKGSHEFWPTSEWYIYSPTDANGKGLSFLSKNIPNLGEVENPLNEYGYAQLVLRYNGFWGCWSKSNSPPPGPTLHYEWTYPDNSSIRWQLQGMEY